MIVLAVFFIVVATWTQVTTPELTGKATDCFLVPAGVSAFGQFAAPAAQPDSQPAASSSCCLAAEDPATLSFSHQIIYKAYRLGGFEMIDPATATGEARIAGLARLILVVIGLFLLGAILTGATFFTMAWTGSTSCGSCAWVCSSTCTGFP